MRFRPRGWPQPRTWPRRVRAFPSRVTAKLDDDRFVQRLSLALLAGFLIYVLVWQLAVSADNRQALRGSKGREVAAQRALAINSRKLTEAEDKLARAVGDLSSLGQEIARLQTQNAALTQQIINMGGHPVVVVRPPAGQQGSPGSPGSPGAPGGNGGTGGTEGGTTTTTTTTTTQPSPPPPEPPPNQCDNISILGLCPIG